MSEQTQIPRSGTGLDTARTRALLACGVVSGPLFVLVALAQALTRDGFDLRRQPISLLSLGDLGWLQITNFVLSGALAMAFAVGMRRTSGVASGRWAPLLVAIYGAGMIAGGAFLPDPALGYPIGTADGIPDQFSWHGTVHAIAPPVTFVALIAACFVLARRFTAARHPAWAVYSTVTGLAALTLSAWPAPQGASIRLFVAAAIAGAWLTSVALLLTRAAPGPASRVGHPTRPVDRLG